MLRSWLIIVVAVTIMTFSTSQPNRLVLLSHHLNNGLSFNITNGWISVVQVIVEQLKQLKLHLQQFQGTGLKSSSMKPLRKLLSKERFKLNLEFHLFLKSE